MVLCCTCRQFSTGRSATERELRIYPQVPFFFSSSSFFSLGSNAKSLEHVLDSLFALVSGDLIPKIQMAFLGSTVARPCFNHRDVVGAVRGQIASVQCRLDLVFGQSTLAPWCERPAYAQPSSRSGSKRAGRRSSRLQGRVALQHSGYCA